MAIISFNEKPIDVKLNYDTGKKVEGKWGDQYMWGCNEDDVFYATPTLNAIIMMTGIASGDTISINKKTKVGDDGKEIPFFLVNGKTLDELKEGQQHTQSVDMIKGVFGDVSEVPKSSDSNKRLDSLESRVSKLEQNKSDSSSDEEIPF